ncbi:uncharacterized protein LAESUDRAFT_760580 [Laetiporus sulphureus 93-53]|uniref:Uncharacterized protein n=1 Tax=Laetiporus sulphureus 93-53 TaxID=1314785 RepID=A0A165DL86_9APHY|nr:uncharacterized protein LAESUDRAFT_760580 [Laetiporus sulphureus 93-53]KZT05130.1 hypothetical protein LAESUDRAFT_760580 [Laetiporus sulphureus 93-53]
MASDVHDSDGWLSLKKIYCRKGWTVPTAPEASVMVKASHHQISYDWLMHDANTAESEKVAELELPLNTPIDEYEVALTTALHLLLVSSLLATPAPETGSEVKELPDKIIVKQEKDTADPSCHNLAIPPLPCGHSDWPSKHPRFNDSDPNNIMMQHFHASTIVVSSTKVLKLRSSKGKAHVKGSSKSAIMKSELTHASSATIEPSLASTQLERIIELSQQLLKENRALRAHKS